MTTEEYAKKNGIKKIINTGAEELTEESKEFINAVSKISKKDYFEYKDKAPRVLKTKKRKK